MGLERHEVHDLEVRQPYSGHQSLFQYLKYPGLLAPWQNVDVDRNHILA